MIQQPPIQPEEKGGDTEDIPHDSTDHVVCVAVREEQLVSRSSAAISSQAVKPVTPHSWQGEEATTENAHEEETCDSNSEKSNYEN